MPKDWADVESSAARWLSLEDLKSGKYPLRGSEPIEYLEWIDGGGTILPLSVLAEYVLISCPFAILSLN